MRLARFVLNAILLLVLVMQAAVADTSAFKMGMKYQELKALHEQRLQMGQSRQQQLEDFRSIVRVSRYGDRGLERIFKNFDGKYAIDPTIPGVRHSVTLLASGSQSQSKGYVRELLYATAFHNDPRFELVEMNRIVKRDWGNTDKDLVVRHKTTDRYARIEVKDVSLTSQSNNIEDLKKQINKMAMEGRLTGQSQYWVNRRDVLPEIRRYASSKGINVYGNVSMGITPKNGLMSSKTFMDNVDKSISRSDRNRSVLAAGQLANGAWMLAESIPNTFEDIQAVLNPEARTTQDWMHLGSDLTADLAGSTMLLSGTLKSASRYASESLQGRSYSMSKNADRFAVAFIAADEAFLIWRYREGDVSSREFWTTQWLLGASMTGGYGGALLGRMIGTSVPLPSAGSIGSLLGGFTGNYFGRVIGKAWVNDYYDMKFGAIDKKFGEAVYKHYKVP